MPQTDLILLHAPSIYDFRKKPVMYGPISDVVPSTPIFEMYPIGFMTMREYLQRNGFEVRIFNVALRMVNSRRFDPEKAIRSLNPMAFGIDLHWLVHAHGSLELGRIIKKHHPETPIILGGLSASYFHEELILYPHVDYVLRGDSVEEPLRQLLSAIKERSSPEAVPNLTWKSDGEVRINALSHVPKNLDDLSFNYKTMMQSASWHRDLLGHLPFRGWVRYPIVVAMQCRGCVYQCLTCGGSASAFRTICGRESPAFRSPEHVTEDIRLISRYFNGPIILIGDFLQSGLRYAHDLLDGLQRIGLKNHMAVEFFSPPPREFLTRLARAIPNFNVQISPESHDEEIRKSFGKNYTNEALENAIRDVLELGCSRVDIFFMIGLPFQTQESVLDTVEYCDRLMDQFGQDGKIVPYVSPLAPFLDPGSRAFENPGKYGYRIIHRTLEEHRIASLAPSWKHTLNYETKWMSRDQIAAVTYEAAILLSRLKRKHGLLSAKEAVKLEERIARERRMMEDIDSSISQDGTVNDEKELKRIMGGYNFVDHSTICRKNEMKWPSRLMGFRLLIVVKEMINGFLARTHLNRRGS